jgi:hypothetical protein
MANAAPKHPTDAKEHRASRATARANKPRPRSTKRAARSVQSDPLSNRIPILLVSTHSVFECDEVRIVTPEFHTDPTHF